MTKRASAIPDFPIVQFDTRCIFPFHVVQSIFGYIKQTDALECLLVCRAWYVAVPQYTAPIWETVNFSKFKRNCSRLAQCLGPHVRRVILTDDVQSVLLTLINCNCCHVDSIKFNKTTTLPKSQQLIGLLRRIGASTLHFHKLECEVCIADIVLAYPQLSDFSCTYSKSLRIMAGSYEGDHMACAAQMQQSNIRTLRLDVRLRPLIRFLSLCPNLQSLHLWLQWPGLLNHNIDVIDFHHLFKICPQLEQLKCYWPDQDDSPYHWQPTTNEFSPSNRCQLRTFFSSVALGHGPNEIIPIIRRHQQTLHALHIDNYDLLDIADITWDQLKGIQTTRLRQLFTRNLPWQCESISSFLSQCHLLCDLTLHELDARLLENHQVLTTFSTLKNLRNFELVLNPKLRLRSTTASLSNLLEVIAFTTASLERLCVSGFDVLKDDLLSAAALNKNLRILKLGMGDPLRRNKRPTTDVGIAKFVDELGPHIQHLELTNLKLGSKSFLSKLAERKELTKLVLVCCGKVSDAGLKAFLKTKVNCLHYIRLDSCHVEHHSALITYCRDELRYSMKMTSKNQFHISCP
ncbi:hypothetical protein BJV82DRAFT_708404 [Fennellomyces sp. T-0311]|nr:hypothetical protein BJV82DRAFT_708404 [Fennellomyces sp. T-0311]